MAPNGLVMYRSALHGGITSEVLWIFNESALMERLVGIKFAVRARFPFFHLFDYAAHGVVPTEGLADGVQIGVGDSAYHRVSAKWQGHFYLPSKLRADGENLTVSGCCHARRALMWAHTRARS